MTKDRERRIDVVTFYRTIIPCLVGRNEWDKKCMNMRISDIVSTSIEAMGLWIIDNYSEKWSTGGRRTDKAKYTSVNQGNRIFGGWNKLGIQRFNEFVTFVRDNRKEDGGQFECEFQEYCRDSYEKLQEHKNDVVLENTVRCLDDLEDDDNWESECSGQVRLLKDDTLNLKDSVPSLRGSVPSIIDVAERKTRVCEMDAHALSVASQASGSTNSSDYHSENLYGSFTNIRNRTVV